jgi:hypothetical protein
MAVNNTMKQETFMKMAEFQPGLGVGAEKYRLNPIYPMGLKQRFISITCKPKGGGL